MIYILCFGNPFIEEDSLAVRIADRFQKSPVKGIEFIKCVAPDEILGFMEKDFYILDVVDGIDEVGIIDDIDMLSNEPKVTVHDFDLGFFLRMMKGMGRIEKVRIIGIPKGISGKDAGKKEFSVVEEVGDSVIRLVSG